MSAQSIIWTFLALILACVSIFGQNTVTIKPSVVTGDVVAISDTEIQLKTDASQIIVELEAKTTFKRVRPENPTLGAAVEATVAEIGEGDKLLVTGVFSNDRKRLPARAVYLMTKVTFQNVRKKSPVSGRQENIGSCKRGVRQRTK